MGMSLRDSTLLHLYCPGLRPRDQYDTFNILAAIEYAGTLSVVHCPGPDEYDNAKSVIRYWGAPGDLYIVEQDIIATPWRIMELSRCPEPVCAWDFELAHGVPWSEVPDGTGIGLWKATKAAREAVIPKPPVPIVPWHDLAWYLKQNVGASHVHRPLIGHNHRA